MKRRRTLIIALLLVAALALGIGYAGMTGSIKINGDVMNKPHEVNLTFETTGATSSEVTEIKTETGSGESGEESSISISTDKKLATFSIRNLAHQNEYVLATLVVKNNNEYDVKLGEATVSYALGSGVPEFFTVETSWVAKLEGEATTDDLILQEGETRVLEVKVIMGESTGNQYDGDFVVTVPGESVT